MNQENIEANQTGLLLDDPRILGELPQYDLVFGAAEPEKNIPDWNSLMPEFRPQGYSTWCTAFAATNIGSAFNKKETGKEVLFSPYELFYRTGGSYGGNTLVNAAAGMRQGFVLENDKPTPVPSSWSTSRYQEYKDQADVSKEALEQGKPYAMKSFVVVPNSPFYLKKALETSPVMLAIGVGDNYWNTPSPKRSTYGVYHCNTLTGFDAQGNYEIFESVRPRASYDGRHKLAADYEILYALAFVDLPNDWYEIQSLAKDKTFRFALAHYGQTRNVGMEQICAQDFAIIVRKHPTLTALAGKYWTVIVNALTYGEYSVTDILNHLTHERRTGSQIFDLNEIRSRN